MKKNNIIYCLCLIGMLVCASMLQGCGKKTDSYSVDIQNKNERQFINKGNKLYNDGQFEDAEIEYRKAVQENPNSIAANYNLALSLIMQVRDKRENNKNNGNDNDTTVTSLLNEAEEILTATSTLTDDKTVTAMIYHNLGNLKYDNEDYQNAIENYKLSLKANPNDDDTRYNLRMAQLKLNEQKGGGNNNDQQNQDQQNKDQQNQGQQDQQQNQQQDQDKENGQQKNGQDQQDKDKQNQDKGQQDKGQNQNQDQRDEQQNGNKDQNKAQQNSGNEKGQPYKMDDRNIEQVLKAAQDKENAVRVKVNRSNNGQERRERQATRNKW